MSSVSLNPSYGTIQSLENPPTHLQGVLKKNMEVSEQKFNQNYTLRDRCTAITGICTGLGGLSALAGFVFWPLFIVAGVFFVAAAASEIYGQVLKSRYEKDLRSIKHSNNAYHDLTVPIERPTKEENIQFTNEKLKQSRDYEETYSTKDLIRFVEKNKLFEAGIPYRTEDVQEVYGTPYFQVFYRHCVNEVLGLKKNEEPRERLLECLKGKDPELRNRALQLTAFLRILGDGNQPFPKDINVDHLIGKGIALFIPTQHGRLKLLESLRGSNLPTGDVDLPFKIKRIVVPLQTVVDQQVLTSYQFNNKITVCQPDSNGNVRITINYSFKTI